MSFLNMLKIAVIPTLIASSCATYIAALLLDIYIIISSLDNSGGNKILTPIIYLTLISFIFGSIFNIIIFIISTSIAAPLYLYLYINNKIDFRYRVITSNAFNIIITLCFYFVGAGVICEVIFIYGLFISPLCTEIFHRSFISRLSKLESQSTQLNESHPS